MEKRRRNETREREREKLKMLRRIVKKNWQKGKDEKEEEGETGESIELW